MHAVEDAADHENKGAEPNVDKLKANMAKKTATSSYSRSDFVATKKSRTSSKLGYNKHFECIGIRPTVLHIEIRPKLARAASDKM